MRDTNPTCIAIAFRGVALALVLALAGPAVANAQQRGEDMTPRQLWMTYPLDPSKGNADIRGGTDADRRRAAPPSAVDTTTGPEARDAEGQMSKIDERSSDMPVTAYVALSLVGLLVVVVVVRSVAGIARKGSGALMRFGAGDASPLGPVPTVPPRKFAAGSLLPIASRHRALAIFSKRGDIVFYAIVILASIAVGVGVSLFLSTV